MKLLFLDCETSGLFPGTHKSSNEICQIACIFENLETGETKTFEVKMRLDKPENMSPQALEKQGVTLETIQKYMKRDEAYKLFMDFLDSCVNRFDKNDKMFFVAYNAIFDNQFIRSFLSSFNNKFFGAYFYYESFDILAIAMIFKMCGSLNTPNMRLETLCNHFKIIIRAHDALSDIQATRQLFQLFEKHFDIKPINLT